MSWNPGSPQPPNWTSMKSSQNNVDQDGQDDMHKAEFDLDVEAPDEDVIEELPQHLRSATPFWCRQLRAILSFASPSSYPSTLTPAAVPLLSPHGQRSKKSHRQLTKPILRCLLYLVLAFFVMLGIIQFIVITCGIVITFFPDEFDRASNYWHHRHHNLNTAEAVSHWPTDISRDITPIGCHSHNDYWRRVPLFSALQAGCISVEADVWLFDDDLYVGHTTSALAPKRTLRTMYIEPLLRVLDKQNPTTHFNRDRHAASASASRAQGVFDTDPAQTLVLLIDFKTDGPATWSHVVAQLSPLRERGYLTHFNGKEVIPGPVTVVGTGNTPFDLLTSVSTYRDIFFDAPLDVLIDDNNTTSTQYQDEGNQAPQNTIAKPAPTGNRGQGLSGTSADMIINPNTFNTTNSYYASVSFRKSIGMPWQFHLSDQQMARIRKHVQAAHSHGLKVRYWGIPSWPRSLRNHIWTVLARESVDILNVDDLESAARKDWRPSLFDWWS